MSLIKQKKYNLFQNSIYLAKESWTAEHRIMIYMIIVILAESVLPVFDIWMPKVAIELLVQKATPVRMAAVLGALVAAMMLIKAIDVYFRQVRVGFVGNMRKWFVQKILLKSLDCMYSVSESSECMERERAARIVEYNNQSAVAMYHQVPQFIVSVVCFFLYSAILSTLHIGVVLYLFLTSGIVYWFARRETRCQEETKDAYTKVRRKFSYVVNQCGDVKAGKDIRVYGMSDWLGGLIHKLLGESIDIHRQRSRQGYQSHAAGALLDFLRDGLAYAFLIVRTLQGAISMGDFMLYFGAITGFGNWIIQIIYHIKNLNIFNMDVNDLRTYLEIPDEDLDEGEREIPNVEDGVEIRFEHVSFHYPESGKWIIRDLNLRIDKGERVALVGLNGAGKTTLVKLMTGLYEPTEGTIFINGIESGRISRRKLFSLFSAVFQDILIMPARLDENIAMCDSSEADQDKVDSVLELAGLAEEFREWGITSESYMTKVITEKGIQLSGGQQQKLMLARALYKDAPVLVLDEPTAALDPLAEQELYEKYKELCEGKTALFISHRLASTQFSDRILFMKNGAVAESGSHEELLRMDGEYAHLYEMQSHYYNLKEEEKGVMA